MKPASAVSSQSGRMVFLVGGILFVLSGLLALLQTPLTPLFAWGYTAFSGDDLYTLTASMQVAGGALAALAMIVFAVGTRRGGSVVSRRPVGMIAILVFALWPYLAMLVWTVVPYEAMAGAPAVSLSFSFIPIVAGLVGVFEIVRIRAVPGGWRWLPAIALLFVVVPPALVEIAQSLNWNNGEAYAPVVAVPFAIYLFATFVVPLVLGTAAIVLALVAGRHRGSGADETVQPPAESMDAAPAPRPQG